MVIYLHKDTQCLNRMGRRASLHMCRSDRASHARSFLSKINSQHLLSLFLGWTCLEELKLEEIVKLFGKYLLSTGGLLIL